MRAYYLLRPAIVVLIAVNAGMTGVVRAVDLEAFEFNDPDFTELQNAVNSANNGNNWSTDLQNLTESIVLNGKFRVALFNPDVFVPSYLQIDNVDSTVSGSRFIVAEMSGWDIRGFDAANGEQIRFGFIDDDTGVSGSRVTAQMQIARNTTTMEMQIEGNAIGQGSTDISLEPTVNTVQTEPFTMVLELNKTSNTYEVFYKDGTKPSQSLGIGAVAPDRDGNSVRFVIVDNFGSEVGEFFDIERVALTDVNPLTDLLTLEVNRDNGVMRLINTTGGPLNGLESYSITSNVGALDPNGWTPITDNYDNSAGPGDGSVDADDDWAIGASSSLAFNESAQGGDGGTLASAQEVVLSTSGGSWVKNPMEDLRMELLFAGGVTRRANVNFVGNGGKRFEVGDLNFDGSLTEADWSIFIAGAETDLSGLSIPEAYQRGDFDGDGVNSIQDFGAFKTAFDAANGAGAFAAMLANIPEPGSATLFTIAGALLAVVRRRYRHQPNDVQKVPMKKLSPLQICLPLLLIAMLHRPAPAAILEEFTFSDSNGTLLDAAANSANTGNLWSIDVADLTNSSVLNGVYRIQKDNDGFATNALEIDNISSGTAWLVAEIEAWSFSSLVGPGEFDAGELEQVRFGFLNNDNPAFNSAQNTANMQIQRTAGGGLELIGNRSGDGGTDITGSAPLNLVQTEPFTMVLELNEDADTYSVFHKSGDGPFQQLGTGVISPTRDGNSLRFVINNNFSGTGEFFDIDRIYLTDESPLIGPVEALKLRINTTTGVVEIVNATEAAFDIDSYRVVSTTEDLNFAGWTSLSDQSIDAVDGPDADSTVGNGIGETWDEAGGADDGVLAESFLLGSSLFDVGRTVSLGSAFRPGGDADSISFQYRSATNGALFDGEIEIDSGGLLGDADGDQDVDGVDFLSLQRNNSGQIPSWEQEFGIGAPASGSLAAVPEPAALTLAGLWLAAVAATRRRPGKA